MSPLLYILVADCLLCNIRCNGNIRGFTLPNKSKVKVKGYADDTLIFVENEESLKQALDLIEDFGMASESKLNRDKTNWLSCGAVKDITNIQGLPPVL